MKKQKQTEGLHQADDRDEQEKRKSGVNERRFFVYGVRYIRLFL